jgi:hypothetical protein
MLRLKPGADLSNLDPVMIPAIFAIEVIYDAEDLICVITAGKDGEHQVDSLHYAKPLCRATDFRTRMIRRSTAEEIVKKIRAKLGKDFDVVMHLDKAGEVHHIHVEYQPKGEVRA